MKVGLRERLQRWPLAQSWVVVTLLGLIAFSSLSAVAAPAGNYRNPEFLVPPGLRARVDFWKDIFTRYGKYDVVIHHRDYPQIIFGHLSFGREAEYLGPVAIDALKKRKVNEAIDAVKSAMVSLAAGARPNSELEQKVELVMQHIPGGVEKYSRAIKNDLIRSQTGIKEKFLESIERSGRYIHAIEKIFVQEYGLPVEVTRLPFIESSFDYQAYSSVGAAGIWQFMRGTGRQYMMVNDLVDERRDPIASTRAAAKYLRQAYSTLGTWPLAITSYNHGVVGVLRKARKYGTSNIVSLIENFNEERPFGFASGNFFPEFLAAVEVYDNYRGYFPGAVLEESLNSIEVPITRPTSIDYVKKQFGLDQDTLRRYNYALAERIWNGRSKIPAGYRIRIPSGTRTDIAVIREPETQVSAPPASSVYGGVSYRVRKGDTLLKIAKQFGVSIAELQESNELRSNVVAPGRVIVIKQPSAPKRVKPAIAQPTPTRKDKIGFADREERTKSGTDNRTPERKYTVQKGDSLWTIARKLGVSVDRIKKGNSVGPKGIKPGQILAVP